jgi:hypothetical protein
MVRSIGALALAAMALGAGCGDNLASPDAAPDGPLAQGSEATSDLVINEVAPRGDGPDWVELYNRGVTPVDLCGVFFTDAVDRLDHYLPLGGVMPPAPCPPRLLGPGDRLVILADDTPIVDGVAIDPGHAPFQLGVADEVHLMSMDGAVIDGLLFLYPPGPEAPPDVTLARVPDGSGRFFERAPSPSAANPEVAP